MRVLLCVCVSEGSSWSLYKVKIQNTFLGHPYFCTLLQSFLMYKPIQNTGDTADLCECDWFISHCINVMEAPFAGGAEC